jgi:hypothetical protein
LDICGKRIWRVNSAKNVTGLYRRIRCSGRRRVRVDDGFHYHHICAGKQV